MPNTPKELARLKMQRVALSLQPWPAASPHPPVRVTCSAGLAAVNVEEGLSAVLGRADAALYEPKQSGRNTIRIARHAPGIVDCRSRMSGE